MYFIILIISEHRGNEMFCPTHTGIVPNLSRYASTVDSDDIDVADTVTCTVTLPKGDATVTTTVVKYGIIGLIANQVMIWGLGSGVPPP